jgi:hypothetical protein
MFVYWRGAVNHPGVTASSRPATSSQHKTRLALELFPSQLFRRRLAREIAVLAAVVLAAFLLLRGQATSQGFSVDESRWIATSRYFWITFIDRDLFGPAWQPSYIVYTHPPVARYLIGFGLWLQGWTPDQLNGRYDSLQSRLYNERMHNVPNLDLLRDARQVTLVFAVASVGLLYVVARSLGGIAAGLATTVLALVSPLLTTVWTRALAESILAAFSLLGLALALHVMPRVGALGRRSWLPLTVGAALALAAATKLSGAIGPLGLGLFALVQQNLALLTTRRTRGLRSWVDVGLMVIVLFVAVNPLLYWMPVDRAIYMVRHRHDEMEFQRSIFAAQAVPDNLTDRIERVARRTFDDYATPAGPLPLSPDVVLVGVGLSALIWRSIAELRRRAPGPAFLFLCWLGMTYAVVTPNLGFDSSHYFVPLVALNAITSGVAVAALLSVARRRIGRSPGPPWTDKRHEQAETQKVQAPTR